MCNITRWDGHWCDSCRAGVNAASVWKFGWIVINEQRHKYHECVERAHVNIITCTVCKTVTWRTHSWSNQLIDIIIAWTGFGFNGKRPEQAAVTRSVTDPVTADFSSDDSICYCWVSTTYPQWDSSATAGLSNTRVWDMSAQAVNEETIPASPGDRRVTVSDWSICIIDGSPCIVQHSVGVAGVCR